MKNTLMINKRLYVKSQDKVFKIIKIDDDKNIVLLIDGLNNKAAVKLNALNKALENNKARLFSVNC